jgi:hypothetical protein
MIVDRERRKIKPENVEDFIFPIADHSATFCATEGEYRSIRGEVYRGLLS